jgi:hypothetical protein
MAETVTPTPDTGKKGRKWKINATDTKILFIQNMEINLQFLTDEDIDTLNQDPSVKTALMPFLSTIK